MLPPKVGACSFRLGSCAKCVTISPTSHPSPCVPRSCSAGRLFWRTTNSLLIGRLPSKHQKTSPSFSVPSRAPTCCSHSTAATSAIFLAKPCMACVCTLPANSSASSAKQESSAEFAAAPVLAPVGENSPNPDRIPCSNRSRNGVAGWIETQPQMPRFRRWTRRCSGKR